MPLYIDNKEIVVKKHSTILQICSDCGLFIPRFCFHQGLSIAANCRMCLVQVEDSLKLLASCAVTTSPNLKIFTKSDVVKKARESIIEFLLINHPLDCPICDQGGECDLQDQTVMFGSDRGRYYEQKRAIKELTLGPIIKTFMSRCIHCTRCVRFANEVLSIDSLGLIGRGGKARITTFIKALFISELSGNIADICPVGALTLKPYAFMSRSWEHKHFVCVDFFDSFGANIRVDVRNNEIMRVLPYGNNLFTNFDWITDRIRFSLDGLFVQRLSTPFLLVAGFSSFKLTVCSWAQISSFLFKIFEEWSFCFFFSKSLCFNFSKISFSLGPVQDMRDYLAFRKLSSGTNFNFKFNSCFKRVFFFQPVFRSNYTFLFNSASFSLLESILVLGLNVAKELPLFNVILNKFSKVQKRDVLLIATKQQASFSFITAGLSMVAFLHFLLGRSPLPII